MHRLLRAGILITFGMFIIFIISGCADDVPTKDVDHDHSILRAHTVKVYPGPLPSCFSTYTIRVGPLC